MISMLCASKLSVLIIQLFPIFNNVCYCTCRNVDSNLFLMRGAWGIAFCIPYWPQGNSLGMKPVVDWAECQTTGTI